MCDSLYSSTTTFWPLICLFTCLFVWSIHPWMVDQLAKHIYAHVTDSTTNYTSLSVSIIPWVNVWDSIVSQVIVKLMLVVWMPLSCIVTFVSVSHYLSALSLSHSERKRESCMAALLLWSSCCRSRRIMRINISSASAILFLHSFHYFMDVLYSTN